MFVRVKAVEGRIAREAPNGPFIPSDEFVTIEATPYVNRLIYHWGDLILEPEAKATESAPVAVKPAPTTKPEKENT